MKQISFENTADIIKSAEDYLRPLIGRKLTSKEKNLVKEILDNEVGYTTVYDQKDRRHHVAKTMSERNWRMFLNKLVFVFDQQIKEFDAVLDSIVLLKSMDPNVIFGYTEDGINIESFD
jgi:hypothetical protein